MFPTDIGALLKVLKGINPVASAAAVINGSAIDRSGFQSCVLSGQAGAAAGAPTARTVDFKLQESADGSTNWADISGAAVTTIIADNGEAHVNVNLAGVKKFIRIVATVTFTGGTTPTIPVAATVALGGAVTKPTSY